MKFTIALCEHNLYRMMRNQWKDARKRKVLESSALKNCEANNLEVIDANEFVTTPKPTFE